ncbi:MAG: hypothetical protein ACK4UJ_07280 [Leptonema sp. (in: bacteria)]
MIDSEKSKLLKIIKNLDPSLFNGHTEFKNLNHESKILWLMQISIFIFEVYSSLGKDPKIY